MEIVMIFEVVCGVKSLRATALQVFRYPAACYWIMNRCAALIYWQIFMYDLYVIFTRIYTFYGKCMSVCVCGGGGGGNFDIIVYLEFFKWIYCILLFRYSCLIRKKHLGIGADMIFYKEICLATSVDAFFSITFPCTGINQELKQQL